MFNFIIKKIYDFYVTFRTVIGWYRTREIWLAYPSTMDEQEIHSNCIDLLEKNLVICGLSLPPKYHDSNKNEWFEKMHVIGTIGDWGSNLFKKAFHKDNSIFVPSGWLADIDLSGAHSTTVRYVQDYVDDIPSECVIHIFENPTAAKIDYDVMIDRLTGSTKDPIYWDANPMSETFKPTY